MLYQSSLTWKRRTTPRAWKYGILRDLHDTGLGGRRHEFIGKFLTDRLFHVRVGFCLSDAFKQEMGVPQESIPSVTLFILKINSTIKFLPAGVRGSLYVDDFLICFRSKSVIAIECQLQHCINSIQKWVDENWFQFSKSKTVCTYFSNQNSIHEEPDLKLYGTSIPVVIETKFLGVVFDRKLTFVAHIKYLKYRCLKALTLLRVVAHKDWGADSATLLKRYQTHVRSKLAGLWLCGLRVFTTVGSGESWPGPKRSTTHLPWSLPHLTYTQPTHRS